jgi:hypothetical protein
MGMMRRLISTLAHALLGLSPAVRAQESEERASVIIVAGAGGTEEYASAFTKWAANWQQACATANASTAVIGVEKATESSDRDRLRALLEAERKDGTAELWLVLMGHGTADPKEAKFNLRGDDVSASDLAAWLKDFRRPVVVINAFSASGAFLKPLAGPDRVVLTATRSGSEENFARLGQHLSETIADPAADLDKDGQVSLLEAWLAAATRVATFYKDEGRLATEHSLLEDNGDGLGTPPDFFRGVRAIKKPRDGAASDGLRAHQIHLVRNAAERALPPALRAERDALELQLAKLRDTKASLPEDAYLRELEAILLKLARVYEQAPVQTPSGS